MVGGAEIHSVLQVLLFGGYYLYCREVFPLLPRLGLPAWHQ